MEKKQIITSSTLEELKTRLTKAAELLKTTELSILEVAMQCGFNYQSYFGKKFMERYHLSPGKYRKHYSTGFTMKC